MKNGMLITMWMQGDQMETDEIIQEKDGGGLAQSDSFGNRSF